ncbi:transcriptional regulator with XRE-family HTH domain [Dyadobacter sp. BE34]|uniref:Transcriptional regulator with XRE-family HTH domain n=1 Tax=Dyadobacter fermentans TaxID=94254 RepID=A0ABU1QWM5_9BACT|nr:MULTISPECIES: helix-turn-helix transcriptional regulator [Dyadobacter]MDR6805542.1 transcriptional regulator with XRE-family HTH domain [Dyadobacter fermentans]MDR7042698.1 transcriptional regulator with XRE-family HTH domain [Dyadobacter sp. BE242]MDR7197010.1 transcriptional regulator with XRE-family HTH domain [Dyadobacter sp. BE34]MDR7215555.1 transcriptional regulator with XRE-family HTH domain [Dyadobacter sp. BE31]MDR7263091.1 transcriptional regulator with XRE-family HTH domain [Dya
MSTYFHYLFLHVIFFIVGFSEKVKEIIEKQGLTQSELANKMGVSRQSISSALKQAKPHAKTIEAFAKVLGVAASELVENDEENNINIQFAQRLKKMMEHYGVSGTDLAERTGIAQPVLNGILLGKLSPSMIIIASIMKIFPWVSMEWALHGSGSMNEIWKSSEGLNIRKDIKSRKETPPENEFIEVPQLGNDQRVELTRREHSKIDKDAVDDLFAGSQAKGSVQEIYEFATIGTTEVYKFIHGYSRYVISMPLIYHAKEQGYAYYSKFWNDEDYLISVGRHVIAVDSLKFSTYRSFVVGNDPASLENGLDFNEGDIITGGRVEQKTWKDIASLSTLHDVIVNCEAGIFFRRIKAVHPNGRITLEATNPDKDKYPDFELDLDNTFEIYEIEVVTRYKK